MTKVTVEDIKLLEKLELLIPRGEQKDESGAKYNNDIIWSLIKQYGEAERLEGRIEAGIYFRGYMISTSPFIEQKLNPYLTEQRQKIKAMIKEQSK